MIKTIFELTKYIFTPDNTSKKIYFLLSFVLFSEIILTLSNIFFKLFDIIFF